MLLRVHLLKLKKYLITWLFLCYSSIGSGSVCRHRAWRLKKGARGRSLCPSELTGIACHLSLTSTECWLVLCALLTPFCSGTAGCAAAAQLLSSAVSCQSSSGHPGALLFTSSLLQELWQCRRWWGLMLLLVTSFQHNSMYFSKTRNALLPDLLRCLSYSIDIYSKRKEIGTYSMVCVCRPLLVSILFKYSRFPSKLVGQNTAMKTSMSPWSLLCHHTFLYEWQCHQIPHSVHLNSECRSSNA